MRWRGKSVVIDDIEGLPVGATQHFINGHLAIFEHLIESEAATLLLGSTSISQFAVYLSLKPVYRGKPIYLARASQTVR
jgi:hypothetical protein